MNPRNFIAAVAVCCGFQLSGKRLLNGNRNVAMSRCCGVIDISMLILLKMLGQTAMASCCFGRTDHFFAGIVYQLYRTGSIDMLLWWLLLLES